MSTDGSQATSEAEHPPFDEEEAPTRQSGEIVRAYARESEALLARGRDPDDAQVLVETMRCKTATSFAESGEPSLAAIVSLAVSSDELGWFPLGTESAAIAAAVDGHSTVDRVLARAGVSPSDGLPCLAMLIDMGLVRLD
jgi:hypothetical protein